MSSLASTAQLTKMEIHICDVINKLKGNVSGFTFSQMVNFLLQTLTQTSSEADSLNKKVVALQWQFVKARAHCNATTVFSKNQPLLIEMRPCQ